MSIAKHIEQIKNAVLGKEVKAAIVSAIEAAYDDAVAAGNTTAELADARGDHQTLSGRLSAMDEKIEESSALSKRIIVSDALPQLEEGQICILMDPQGTYTIP